MTSTTIENTAVDGSLNIDELTTASLTGTGVFDVLLQTLRLHLDREFKDGRITGTAYATVYSQALTTFLEQSIGYCLNKAKLAFEIQQMQEQIELLKKQQAQTEQQTRNLFSQQSQIDAETDKVFYEINYLLPEQVKVTKLTQDQLIAQNNKLATETAVNIKQGHLTDAQTCQVHAETNQINATVATRLPEEVELIKRNQAQVTAQTAVVSYELEFKLPEEVELIKRNQIQTTTQTSLLAYDLANTKVAEVENLYKQGVILDNQAGQITAQTALAAYELSDIKPAEKGQIEAQITQLGYTVSYVLPAQVANTEAQTANADSQTVLYNQKLLTEKAQTETTPAANSVMGVQNALMVRQADSYLRDAEQKASKMLIDTWSVRRNLDANVAPADSRNKLDEDFIGGAVGKMLAGIGVV